jgi:hypothetical protein
MILLFILSIAIAVTWRKYSLPPMQRFTEDFDNSIGRADPAIGKAVAADPDLHRLFLLGAKEAYDQGGWDAASTRVQQLKWSLLARYASDKAVLACANATLTMALAEQDPASPCPLVALNSDGLSRMTRASIDRLRVPCDAAVADGAAQRLHGQTPPILDEDSYVAAFAKSLEAPDPLTQAERSALMDPLAPHTPVCRAIAKMLENQLSLPQAPRLFRTQMMSGGTVGAIDGLNPVKKPPAEMLCPRAGTVFTLSMERTLDGRPITWTAIRPEGWDCIIDSSATGRRGLWGADFINPIRRLWPLEVGKSTTITASDENNTLQTSVVRVESFEHYWLSIGSHSAYALSQTVLVGGRPRYIITHYYSPELGFKIGQHTQVLWGDWPAGIAPDWQLIAIQAAPAP